MKLQKQSRRSSASKLFRTLSGLDTLSGLNAETRKRSWLAPLVYLAHNPLTFAGLFLVNLSAVLWFFVLPVATREAALHPYLLVFFLGVLPAAFLAGVVLLPVGIFLRYRNERARGLQARWFRPFDFSNREFRNISVFFVGATAFNVLVGGYFSQATIHYMDSSRFCGTTCHSMVPEYTAYLSSPHRNVECVECHIGSGRGAHLQAKLNGLRQVYSSATNRVPRPIPTPIHGLRPAREICESCHWPEQFSGIQLRVYDTFQEDSANTRTTTVLALKVGGGSVRDGIHSRHVDDDIRIEYMADSTRRFIPWVQVIDSSGVTTSYATRDWDGTVSSYERRVMDCLDCHTRPSHRFQDAARALDEAMARGAVDAGLPWIRRRGLELLRAYYRSHDEAREAIRTGLVDFYQTEHPEIARTRLTDIHRSADGLAALYERNVFPDMNLGWGAYPDHSGHAGMSGCFRCHDNMHVNAAGEAIVMDCSACHELLATNESEPAALRRLGVAR